MSRIKRRALVATGAAFALAPALVRAQKKYDPGVTDKEFPWTMGWQPDYATEAAIYAKHILANHKGEKIGMMYQNDDSGKDYLNGFQKGLGPEGLKQLVATVSYEVTDPTVDSQIIQLKD